MFRVLSSPHLFVPNICGRAPSVQKWYPISLLQDLTRPSFPYVVSFLSSASKSFHLDRRCAWWFCASCEKRASGVLTLREAGLCSKVDKLVHLQSFNIVQPFRSSYYVVLKWQSRACECKPFCPQRHSTADNAYLAIVQIWRFTSGCFAHMFIV